MNIYAKPHIEKREALRRFLYSVAKLIHANASYCIVYTDGSFEDINRYEFSYILAELDAEEIPRWRRGPDYAHAWLMQEWPPATDEPTYSSHFAYLLRVYRFHTCRLDLQDRIGRGHTPTLEEFILAYPHLKSGDVHTKYKDLYMKEATQ